MPLPTLAVFLLSWLTRFLNPEYVPEEGDLIFHTSQTRQSKALQIVTGSRYTHMGIVFLRNGEPVVYEAVGPVKYTPLEKWTARGIGGHFVVKRLASPPLTEEGVEALKSTASQYRGKGYDSLFAWCDRRIYCSELVWKMYKEALGVEIGTMEQFGDFDLSHPLARAIVRERWGGSPPKNEPVITPASIFASPLLRTVHRG